MQVINVHEAAILKEKGDSYKLKNGCFREQSAENMKNEKINGDVCWLKSWSKRTLTNRKNWRNETRECVLEMIYAEQRRLDIYERTFYVTELTINYHQNDVYL